MNGLDLVVAFGLARTWTSDTVRSPRSQKTLILSIGAVQAVIAEGLLQRPGWKSCRTSQSEIAPRTAAGATREGTAT